MRFAEESAFTISLRTALRSSISLYDALAAELESGFYDVPHRRAYDQLAWERVTALLPARGATIIDAGCGTGRWVSRLLDLGHRVIGVEQAPGMIQVLERKRYNSRQFRLVAGPMEEVHIEPASADAVLAIGSLPFADDPAIMIQKFASWVRPGGFVAVLADALYALVLELLNAGRQDEALERLHTRRGLWRTHGHEAELHLLDRRTLEIHFAAAGLERIVTAGLLITASAWGVPRLTAALAADEGATLALERKLTADPALADCGKQLLVTGYRLA
jgi:SAM-dependent methyltransferase